MKLCDTWTPGARAMMNWMILSALSCIPSQGYFQHYLFLSPCTPLPWWSIHLFAGFICFSSVCLRNMRASIQITLGFLRRSPHTFCMLFQSAGGYRCHSTNNYSRAIPTRLALAISPMIGTIPRLRLVSVTLDISDYNKSSTLDVWAERLHIHSTHRRPRVFMVNQNLKLLPHWQGM